MRLPTEAELKQGCDFWELSEAANYLANHACAISSRHINDQMLRLQFNREVAYYARHIVRDVEEGRKTNDEGMKTLKAEQNDLVRQSSTIALQGVGVIAGALQVATGAGICYASVGTLCVLFGTPLAAHGANNIYENGRNIWEGRSDTQGPVRKVYQKAAQAVGSGELEGNMAYGAVDLGMSVYGLGRFALKPDSWRLFRYISTDYAQVYTQTSHKVLFIELAAGSGTINSMWQELKTRQKSAQCLLQPVT
ncbi:DUF4225 domain-containing protein, partial [Pseudomonas sp.]|uniref:DUF4225 domain-containing protein n=1 Tax=Pseudomonas sp. TaxID=306 RepID=UPI003CC67B0E